VNELQGRAKEVYTQFRKYYHRCHNFVVFTTDEVLEDLLVLFDRGQGNSGDFLGTPDSLGEGRRSNSIPTVALWWLIQQLSATLAPFCVCAVSM